MNLVDKLQSLAARVPDTVGLLETEEATKTALVLPFISALGYDVFNPLEVVPEYTADVGIKKGEKVDYAIKHEGAVIMIFEAKAAGADLSQAHAGQLYRYFSVTQSTRIAVLTNGVQYHFYSDLEASNRMDDKPFLVLDLLTLKDEMVDQLGKLTKEAYDLDGMLEAAGDLKYMREIRRILDKQFEDPDDDFVKFFFARVCENRNFVQSAKEQFSRLVVASLRQVMNERINARLRSAMSQDASQTMSTPAPAASAAPVATSGSELGSEEAGPEIDDGIETTEEELRGFRVVQAIVCNVLPAARVVYRDTKSYFGILCDDNNRKPICRLHFNRSQKYLGLLDEEKNEKRHPIAQPEDIYDFADELREAAARYVDGSSAGASSPRHSAPGDGPRAAL
ncbi:MAG: type I restriction endonuclease [Myxococcota bacterium]